MVNLELTDYEFQNLLSAVRAEAKRFRDMGELDSHPERAGFYYAFARDYSDLATRLFNVQMSQPGKQKNSDKAES